MVLSLKICTKKTNKLVQKHSVSVFHCLAKMYHKAEKKKQKQKQNNSIRYDFTRQHFSQEVAYVTSKSERDFE